MTFEYVTDKSSETNNNLLRYRAVAAQEKEHGL